MDSIINFIINCILSVIDLYLINFLIINISHKKNKDEKYLKINPINCLCLVILIFINIASPGFFYTILITFLILIVQLKTYHLNFKRNYLYNLPCYFFMDFRYSNHKLLR